MEVTIQDGYIPSGVWPINSQGIGPAPEAFHIFELIHKRTLTFFSMHTLINQLVDGFGRMIQVIQWTNERDRTFRPILIPNPVTNGWK